MVYLTSTIGEIGVFLFNLIILFYLTKHDSQVDIWNKAHHFKKQKIFRVSVVIYFVCWIIISFIAWYYLHFIQLGEFFAMSVVLPAILTMLIKWILT